MNVSKLVVDSLFAAADLRTDGRRPWDARVLDGAFYGRVLRRGSLGLGEAYMDGQWACDDLEEFAYRAVRGGLERGSKAVHGALAGALGRLGNQQTRRRSRRVAERHYDLGNDLFGAFLGRYKNYSCGYFEGTDDLDVAQRKKLDLVCRKLGLGPGDRLLDVGGGFGELARHAAESYGCRVTSINISDEQIGFARELCRGLPVEVVKCDYRDVAGRYDKIAVVAMLTHVGHKNYRRFMRVMRRCLAPGGAMLIESVGGNVSLARCEPWTDRYVFPGGVVPSIAQLGRAFEGLFVLEDLHNFAPSYVATLRAWHRNLRAAWPRLAASGRYAERTRRMFEYFFLTVAGAFRARGLQHWHLVLTPAGAPAPACRLS
ncbi:MAG TPA: cyclopropane fatty acyl phospholipid synthase [Polyangiaceae bacterium]|nr:cyclopropane fatty acyl phospholipid synthase [Polyangiaceae bacterium]